MTVLLAGTVLCAADAALRSPWLALVAAVVLGAGYGIAVVTGLLQVQRIASADDLAGLTGVYYTLAYAGFLLPTVLALVSSQVSYPVLPDRGGTDRGGFASPSSRPAPAGSAGRPGARGDRRRAAGARPRRGPGGVFGRTPSVAHRHPPPARAPYGPEPGPRAPRRARPAGLWQRVAYDDEHHAAVPALPVDRRGARRRRRRPAV